MRSNQVLRTTLAFALAIAIIFSGILTTLAQQAAECTTRITLLQVNDVYQFAPVDRETRGGLARVMTLKKQILPEQARSDFDILHQAVAATRSIAPRTDGLIKRLDNPRVEKSDCVETK